MHSCILGVADALSRHKMPSQFPVSTHYHTRLNHVKPYLYRQFSVARGGTLPKAPLISGGSCRLPVDGYENLVHLHVPHSRSAT